VTDENRVWLSRDLDDDSRTEFFFVFGTKKQFCVAPIMA